MLSISYTNQEASEPIHKVSFINRDKPITEITRLEDVDAWGKQHGCSFVFIKDWKKKEIYTAMGFADAKGGKTKNIGRSNISWEKAIVEAVNEYKNNCPSKLKVFTFKWSSRKGKFYIGDPSDTPKYESKKLFSF